MTVRKDLKRVKFNKLLLWKRGLYPCFNLNVWFFIQWVHSSHTMKLWLKTTYTQVNFSKLLPGKHGQYTTWINFLYTIEVWSRNMKVWWKLLNSFPENWTFYTLKVAFLHLIDIVCRSSVYRYLCFLIRFTRPIKSNHKFVTQKL